LEETKAVEYNFNGKDKRKKQRVDAVQDLALPRREHMACKHLGIALMVVTEPTNFQLRYIKHSLGSLQASVNEQKEVGGAFFTSFDAEREKNNPFILSLKESD